MTLNPLHCLTWAIDPALDWCREHGVPSGEQHRRLLLTIAAQESGWYARSQHPTGPARGLWQFEPAGTKGVLGHPKTARIAAVMCSETLVPPSVEGVQLALSHHDQLAAAFARLLIWSDPYRAPTQEEEAWRMYLRLWRPGKPRQAQWPVSWAQAGAVCATRPLAPLTEAVPA